MGIDGDDGSFYALSNVPPLVRAALVLAAIGALGTRLAQNPVRGLGTPPAALAGGAEAPTPEPFPPRAPCPPKTLPDSGVCIPVPDDRVADGPPLNASPGAHRNRDGNWQEYEQIPRRPDRPASYAEYRYPVSAVPHQPLVGSGYDLDCPDALQRRGNGLKAVGHGGIDLGGRRGDEIRLVALEHQVDTAEVFFVGQLFGNTVVTLHRLRESGVLREYLVLYGHLDGPALALRAGMPAPEGTLLGTMGDSGSPGLVHLHLEIRQVRKETNLHSLQVPELVDNARTIACDPRNLLPIAPLPAP